MRKPFRLAVAAFFAALAASRGSVWAAETLTVAGTAKAKYGPQAILLADSHEYLREAKAPDYWRLSPYYVGQVTDSSCSVAAVAMIVNASRSPKKMNSAEQLATHESLLARTGDEAWLKAVAQDGPGVSLEQIKLILEKALRAYGVEGFLIEAVHVDPDDPKARSRVHQELVRNERSGDDFLVANFSQGIYTGDAEVGHFAPVGAYDARRKRVLILDPDRKWYEPYWVSEKVFFDGIATADADADADAGHKSRGYLRISLKPAVK